MSSLSRRTLPLCAALLIGGQAHAGTAGIYVGVEGGGSWLPDQALRIEGDTGGIGGPAPGSVIGTLDFESGTGIGVVGGYAFASGLRLELEAVHRDNRFSKLVQADGSEAGGLVGRATAEFLGVNGWFDLISSGSVHPYVGAGAGIARTALRDPAVASPSPGLFFDGSNLKSEHDQVFAFQVGGGFRFDVTEHLALSVDYRFLRANRSRYDLLIDSPENSVVARYRSHSAFATLSWRFGAAPAPAVEPPEVPLTLVPADEVEAPPAN